MAADSDEERHCESLPVEQFGDSGAQSQREHIMHHHESASAVTAHPGVSERVRRECVKRHIMSPQHYILYIYHIIYIFYIVYFIYYILYIIYIIFYIVCYITYIYIYKYIYIVIYNNV